MTSIYFNAFYTIVPYNIFWLFVCIKEMESHPPIRLNIRSVEKLYIFQYLGQKQMVNQPMPLTYQRSNDWVYLEHSVDCEWSVLQFLCWMWMLLICSQAGWDNVTTCGQYQLCREKIFSVQFLQIFCTTVISSFIQTPPSSWLETVEM